MQLETTKYRLIFLPEIEFDVLKSLVPADNIVDYEALTKAGFQNFMLKDSVVVFLTDASKDSLRYKARKGEKIA